jgi:hypothetical protein
MESDLAYYRRRAAEEAGAAEAAEHVRVRQVHLELARRYEERVTLLESERGRRPLHLVTAA